MTIYLKDRSRRRISIIVQTPPAPSSDVILVFGRDEQKIEASSPC
jgi:hypothetical protein